MTKEQLYKKIVSESERRQQLGETCRAHMIARYLDGKISSRDLSDTECVVSSEFRPSWRGAGTDIFQDVG